MEKSSLIELPESEEITDEILKDEKIINNLRTILIASATNVVNNTILRNYVTPKQIKENIEKHAKNIKINKGYVGDILLKRNTLLLSEIFFTKPVRDSINQNSNLNEYPELIKLLEIIGLTTALSDTHEDMGYNIGTNETRNVYIKSLIANYFATNYDKKEKKLVSFSGRTFHTYAVSNALQVNMIYAISHIVGEETLAKALVSPNTEEVLVNKIDEITKKKGLGNEFIDGLRSLDLASKELMGNEAQSIESEEFFDNRLAPLINALNNQSKKIQFFITTFLEENNYDIEDYNFHHHPIDVDFTFTKEDIEFIKHYVKRFSEHCEECRKNNTNFVDFFYTKVPEITPREDGWNESDFSFINKVATEISIDRYFYKSAKRNLDAKATNLINLLTESIIPRAIKSKNLSKTKEEFEEMLSYITYENSSIDRSKKGQRKIAKTKKFIIKRES